MSEKMRAIYMKRNRFLLNLEDLISDTPQS